MKNLATLLFSFLLIGMTTNATPNENTLVSNIEMNNRYDGNAYIFTEGTVEFSVFPDGQFDFVFVGPQNGSQVTITSPNGQVSFNSGRDLEAFVQYDDYGAVVQIEEVEVYYDEFGRIIQAGNVDIQYNDRRLVRVGGLNVHYNNFGHFGYTTGFINVFNRGYFFRPWHTFYMRPIFANCIVWDTPYRRFYNPFRYNYYTHVNYWNNRHNVAYINGRRNFYNPGSRVHYRNGRTAINRNFRADRRNTMVTRHGRDNGFARANTRTAHVNRSTNDRVRNSRVANRTTNTNARATTRNNTNRNVARTTSTSRTNNARKNRGTTANRTSRSVARNDNSSARKSNNNSTSRSTARKSTSQQNRSTARASSTRTSKPASTARKSTSRSSNANRSSSRNTSRATTRSGRRL